DPRERLQGTPVDRSRDTLETKGGEAVEDESQGEDQGDDPRPGPAPALGRRWPWPWKQRESRPGQLRARRDPADEEQTGGEKARQGQGCGTGLPGATRRFDQPSRGQPFREAD